MSASSQMLARLAVRVAKESVGITQAQLAKMIADSLSIAYNKGIADMANTNIADLSSELRRQKVTQ